ncbi:MAG: hypothetical protein H7Z40_03375 [Phycisphaerae bacterium]|nr:hypothetical protein [Gemmatimonadaceae bacterium]
MNNVGITPQMVPIEIKEYYWVGLQVWSAPTLWALLAVVFIWQWLRPADTNQSLFGRRTLQDFIWFNFDIALGFALLPAILGGIRMLSDRVTVGMSGM